MKFNVHEIRKGKFILEALLKYGIMNRQTLQVVVPEIKDKRNFQKVLKNLLDRKLIVKRYDHFSQNIGAFYQLNQSSFAREALGKYLNQDPNRLLQKDLRYKELYHEQVLARMAYYFNQKYPQALVLKDNELAKNEGARSIISGLSKPEALKPDLLLIFPKTATSDEVSIAVEFERTAKAKRRLLYKLNFYTQRTSVDGVLYFYSESRIDHNLHEIYVNRVLERALRIRHYGKNFLLTSSFSGDVENAMNLLCNRDKNYYSFQKWLVNLTTGSEYARRDEHFG